MKDGLDDIVGKQIAAVIFATSKRAPRVQVFLVFPDGKCFEFYGESFSCCSGLDDAERIERYVTSAGGEIVRTYGEPVSVPPPTMLTTGREQAPYHVPASETLEGKMQRDLDAWLEAKAAIARARRS